MLTSILKSPRKSTGTRARSGGFPILRGALSNAALALSAMLLICSATNRVARAADEAADEAAPTGVEHEFRICRGYFALCAASICTPTGGKIRVRVSGDRTALFPEADCTCPVFSGEAIADVVGGNMKGSCKPPSPDQLWSIYAIHTHIPQEINGWVPTGPKAAAPPLFCSKNLNLGTQTVNCFSFACDSLSYINNVPVATCHCAIGESLNGTAVPAQTAFVSQAGQGDPAFCAKYPVSGPIGASLTQ